MEYSLSEEEKIIHLQHYFPNRLVKRLMDLYPTDFLDVTHLNPQTLSGGRTKRLPSQGRLVELNELFQGNRLPLYSVQPEKYWAAFTALPPPIQEIHQEEAERTMEGLRQYYLQQEAKIKSLEREFVDKEEREAQEEKPAKPKKEPKAKAAKEPKPVKEPKPAKAKKEAKAKKQTRKGKVVPPSSPVSESEKIETSEPLPCLEEESQEEDKRDPSASALQAYRALLATGEPALIDLFDRLTEGEPLKALLEYFW